MRKANWTLLLVSLLSLGPASWAAGPGVPLQGVEANSLDYPQHFFGNGPSPFPRPEPPKPKPVDPVFVTADAAVALYARAATWWTYTGARLTWHDCSGPIETRLAGEPAEVVTLIKAMAQDMSAQMREAYEPWRETLTDEITTVNAARLRAGEELVGIGLVNAIWQGRAETHAAEIATAIPQMGMALVNGSCDAGGCDCSKPCKKGHTCDCQLYVEGSEDCSILSRDNCNVDIGPDPRGRAITATLDGWSY